MTNPFDEQHIPFDPIADMEEQLGINTPNIHKAEINALLEELGHTLGQEEAAARICEHIPDLEAADQGHFQATQRVMRRLCVMIYEQETGQAEEQNPETDYRDELSL